MIGRLEFARVFRHLTGLSWRKSWQWSKHWADVCGGPFETIEENRNAAYYCAQHLGYVK